MLTYLIRRVLYAIPILFVVNLITFLLFFVVNTPDDIAHMQLGQKYVTPESIMQWKQSHGYDAPLFWNSESRGLAKFSDTLYFQKSIKLFGFDFGRSLQGRDISSDISERMWPSLAIAIPTLIIGLFVNITFAMLLAFFRGTYLDNWGVGFCIVLMSISSMFFIIGGQFFLAKVLKLVPISGFYPSWEGMKFLILPVAIGVVTGVGASTRWYRIIFLEEMHKDYVRTARAKGLSETKVLFKHILRNAMIPIVTNVVVIIPLLFMGSLILEAFFAIPGLGSYTIDAIQGQDFEIVRSMVFLGTFLYIIGLICTDIAYVIVDPRVRLG